MTLVKLPIILALAKQWDGDFLKIIFAAIGLLSALLLWVLFDIIIALTKKPIPDLPKGNPDLSGLNVLYGLFSNPDSVPEGLVLDEFFISEALRPTLDYIDARYDCADFSLIFLLRFYLEFKDRFPDKNVQEIKNTVLNFKYWMDEPGSDSMCYWSENHQILFAVCEYLAGQEWTEEVFSNSGLKGFEHKEKAHKRIEYWMEQRFNYGFSEWYSNNYYPEDIAPMSNFIEFAEDRESAERMKIILDLLWFDVASHSVNNTFVASSSRMYSNNKASDECGNSVKSEIKAMWQGADMRSVEEDAGLTKHIIAGQKVEIGLCGRMARNFVAMYDKGLYKVPEVIKKIGEDKESVVVKASSGLSVKDMKDEGLIGLRDDQIMAQLGAETFTNAEVIDNTMAYISKNKMLRNQFINPFRYFDIKLLRLAKVPSKLSRRFELMTNGIALGRGNVYFFRTPYYSLSTAVAMDVDSCGAQGHIWTANLAPDLCLFTTQPSRDDTNPKKHKESPGYWVGNGRQPMSVQDENINITVYKIPKKKRLLEFFIADMSHAYVPMDKYDRLELENNRVFGQKGKVLVALLASGDLKYRPYEAEGAKALMSCHPPIKSEQEAEKSKFDLVLEGGDYHGYVTELSDTDRESFEDFKKRINSNPLKFEGGTVRYESGGKRFEVDYGGVFSINGKEQPLSYDRFDSKYCQAKRKADEIVIEHAGHSLRLNYKKIKREEI